MRKLFPIGIVSAFLAACGTVSTTTIFKPGATATQKQYDIDKCKIASLRSIPQEFTTTTSGGYYEPSSIDCYRYRRESIFCSRFGDTYVPSYSFTVDQNESMRWRFMQRCLQKKGYDIINSLRTCTSREERDRATNARTIDAFTCNPDIQLDY